MTFHVVALPHTNVTAEHSSCAFNQKVLKFCRMMKMRGHKVMLYSSEKFEEGICDGHVTCITEEERIACLEGKHYTEASFDYTRPHWKSFNAKAIAGIGRSIQPQDFICVIGGLAHKEIADAFPNNMTVEFGIGYSGTFAPYRVFESYAWMHTVYGQQQGAQNAHGIWFDEVIPSYFDLDDFPSIPSAKQDYYLFLGRLTGDKGYTIAREVCEKLGKRLILAGPKGPDYQEGYGEYVGEADVVKRGNLMANAQAVFVPSLYIEPFGSVAVEAQLCGTAVICTDWGAFTETVIEGVTGFHCRTFKQFLEATEKVKNLDPYEIQRHAQDTYSLESVSLMYEEYFYRLMTLWGKGWYAENY